MKRWISVDEVDRLKWPIIIVIYLVVIGFEYFGHVLKEGHEVWTMLPEVILYSIVIILLLFLTFNLIHERQSELKRLKEFSESIVNNAPVGIFTTDKEGRITSANPEHLKIMGSSLEEEIGLNIFELPAVRSLGLDKPFRKALKGEPFEVHNLKGTSLAGKEFYLSVKCTPLKGENNEVVGLLVIMEDVTKRAILEEKIRESEEKYRSLIQTSYDAIFLIDRKTRKIIDVNDAACELSKYSRDEIIGTIAGSRIVPKYRKSFEKEFEKLLKTGKFSGEFELRRKDGSVVPVEIRGSAFKQYLFAIVRDITERKRVEEAHKVRAEQEAAVARIAELSLKGVGIQELMKKTVKLAAKALNVELCKILWLDKSKKSLKLVAGVGWKKGFMGKATVGVGHDSQAGYTIEKRRPVVVEDLRKEKRFSPPSLLYEHGAISGISVPMIYKNKVYGVMGVHSKKPRKFTQMEVDFLQSIANVLTTAIARREAEKKLQLYTAELERSNKLKDLFTDIMRHDLQNPISVIKGMSELLKEEKASKEVMKGLNVIDKNAEKLLEMIRDASKLAKLGAIDELKFEKKDLWKMLEDVASNMGILLDEKGMKVVFDKKGECYAEIHSFMEDVFANIISNAIKYGREKTEIVIGIEDTGESWKISISDKGEGVPDEYKEVIFNRFTRMPKKGVKGTGLGLAIVKRIVELHKGKVWVEDNPGGGSIFYVEIPKKAEKPGKPAK